jgi:release factor glutamine methyltransferase
MTVKEAILMIGSELKPQYPDQEIESICDIIFGHLMNFKKFDKYLQPDATIPDHIKTQIYNIIQQLKQNKPIQYILGIADFYELTFEVNSSVLIPRPETEELVYMILNDHRNATPRIIDIGTGSGCIAIALSKFWPNSTVCAVDISEAALDIARKNSERNKANVEFQKIDILSVNIPEFELFDIVVSNPPYITTAQKKVIDANVLDYEPHLALFVPEDDPLIFYKAIARFSQKMLKKTGTLYFEINEDLPEETASAIETFGFSTELKKDIHDKYRLLKAKPYDHG